ncbi:MAG: glycosyltransferase family 4 protein [Thaumarchaeota archaeon]|nr:glycosyltransferase family 4 protein [Nitrososphaerota archaeon]
MNIIYVTPDVAIPYFRGASTHVFEVSKNLSARGHHVSVVSRRLNRSQPRWEAIDGFETYRTFQGLAFEPPMSSYSRSHVDRESLSSIQRVYSWYLGSYRAFQLGVEVATVMSGREADIVIERETAFGAGAVLSSILGVPMVLEMIGPRVSVLSLKRASKVLAYSTRMVGGRVPREKLEIVSGGVNTEMFRPDPEAGARVRSRYGLTDEFVVGYVGTFPKWHGVNALLSACRVLDSAVRKVKVLLVGPYYADARQFAEGIGMGDKALFAGPVSYDMVPEYINACDVLCAPYDPTLSRIRKERGIGAPLKVLEYMACQKAVISTNVGPVNEVVESGRTGVLVPPGDVNSITDAIRGFIEGPDLLERMGIEARKEVIAKYSWHRLAEILEGILYSASSPRIGRQEALS